jgi:hypothetical protein
MAKKLKDVLHTRWQNVLEAPVLDCEIDTVVGRAVHHLCGAADQILDMQHDEDAPLEERTIEAVRDATIAQINVWYFG